MNPIDSKLKKILAMIDGATSEGEAKAASLALQRLLAANNMTLEDIDLTDDALEVSESVEELGKRVPVAALFPEPDSSSLVKARTPLSHPAASAPPNTLLRTALRSSATGEPKSMELKSVAVPA